MIHFFLPFTLNLFSLYDLLSSKYLWSASSALNKLSKDITVRKTANDSFYNSDLQKILSERDINELVITGCATDFCVDTTISSALNKDYKVTVVKDAHTTADRPHMDAESVIKHYNWIWDNMIPTKHKLRVVECEELIQEFK